MYRIETISDLRTYLDPLAGAEGWGDESLGVSPEQGLANITEAMRAHWRPGMLAVELEATIAGLDIFALSAQANKAAQVEARLEAEAEFVAGLPLKSHSAAELLAALRAGKPVWELDAGSSGEDDTLLGETEEEVWGDLAHHHDWEDGERPAGWTLTRVEV